MKQTNEKKQDLLLDALSCIDEDILERGLALRDGTAAPVSMAAESAPKTTRPATVIPPLYDLTRQPDKPPKKNPWRVLAVAAAACLLLCVIPLSMWMVGSLAKNDAEAGDTYGTHAGILNGMTAADDHPDEPEDGWGENDAPEAEAPAETDGIMFPEGIDPDDWWEAETEFGDLIAIYPHDPKPWSWNVTSNTNEKIQKHIEITLPGSPNRTLRYQYFSDVMAWGSKEEMDAFYAQTISPENEMVLDLYAQYCASLYSMDYGSHFLLFHPDIVKSRFTEEVDPYPYKYALGKINYLVGLMLPYDIIQVSGSLTRNRLLVGDELTEYLANQQKSLGEVGFSADRITAVRCFSVNTTVTVASRFRIEEHERDMTLYCYEYDGVWYLDDSCMDDDLCIDFALSDITEGEDYRRTEARVGTVTAMEEGYIFLDDGSIFTTDAIANKIAESGLVVGDQVCIEHYDFGVSVKDNIRQTEGVLYKALSLIVGDITDG